MTKVRNHTGTIAIAALLLFTAAVAESRLPGLDGTSWKLEVKPDDMAKAKGEKDFDEGLIFTDGRVSTREFAKMGFPASPYSLIKSGEDWTFKTEQNGGSKGDAIWTGTLHEKELDGMLVWTKADGTVLHYTFEGSQLD